jgi:hypothetical protein
MTNKEIIEWLITSGNLPDRYKQLFKIIVFKIINKLIKYDCKKHGHQWIISEKGYITEFTFCSTSCYCFNCEEKIG